MCGGITNTSALSGSLSSIGINYRSKCGLSEADAMFLLTFIFGCLGNDESKSLKEEIKYLYKVEKKYNLKTKSGLESIEAEVKAGLCRFDEDSLTDEEVEELLSLYTNEGHNARYCLQNYKKLVSESVVLIKDAIANGVDYEVLNELKSIVQFYYKDREEFVIEGNKTDKDTYIFPIITDDKFTSKQIMKEHGLNVPNAILLNRNMNAQDREELLKEFYNRSLSASPCRPRGKSCPCILFRACSCLPDSYTPAVYRLDVPLREGPFS